MAIKQTYNYDEISVQQWIEILQDPTVMNAKMKIIIAILYSMEEKKLNATSIAEILGYEHYAPVNGIVGNCGKAIKAKYDIPHSIMLDFHNHWLVVFNGDEIHYKKRKIFNWILKENMLIALKKLNYFKQDAFLTDIISKKSYKHQLIQQQLELQPFTTSERQVICKVRIGQSFFKKQLKQKYQNVCCLCRLNIESLLIASHIKPWAQSNLIEKVDINNGLLLCHNHDALFDKYLITFDKLGKIIIHPSIEQHQYQLLNLHPLIGISLTDKMDTYMQHHREIFSKNQVI